MVAIHKPAHDIILKPVVSEKSYALSDRGQYTFVVAPNANKVQIKQAIEEIFKVKVTNVNTLNRAGKRQRTRTGFGQRHRDRCRGPVDRHLWQLKVSREKLKEELYYGYPRL